MVDDVSAAVGMSLGTKKCAVAHVIAGKVVEAGDIPLKTGGTVLEVKYGKTYRYLGVPQLLGADLKKTKQTITREYLIRLRKTWGSELNELKESRGKQFIGCKRAQILPRMCPMDKNRAH